MVAAGEHLFPYTSFMRGIFPRLNYLVTKYHNMSTVMLYILVFEKYQQKRTGTPNGERRTLNGER
jgi:hypothetical protein